MNTKDDMNKEQEYGYTKLHYVDVFDGEEVEVFYKFPNGSTIPELLERFEAFMRSLGYVFDGELVISENPDYETTNHPLAD